MRRLSVMGWGWVWLGLVSGLVTLPPVQAEPERLALVIGVREFPASEKLSPLAFTEPDAEEIAATLKGSGFRVILMTQAAAKPQGQQRFNPTAAFIRRQFEGLIGTPNLKKEDCLLVTLAGHGIQLPSRTDAVKQTFYFCAADAQIDELKFSEEVQPQHNLIPVQELYDTLKQCEAGVKLLVVDACRNDPNKVDTFRSSNSLTRPPVPLPPGGIATLFSCSTNQRAAEDADLKHGVFSHFFIEALKGEGDLDKDGQIDLTELQKYVSGRTYSHVFEKYGTRQLPEFKGDISGWAPLLTLKIPTDPPPPPPPPNQFAGKQIGDRWEGNSLKMPFRWCPPGKFRMGEDPGRVDVTLTRGFWLGQHEVTQPAWEQIMQTTPWKDQEYRKEDENYPATNMTWTEAMEFCRKLTEQERAANRLPRDWAYTLPTEAQWEYACRAGTKTVYSFGDDETKLGPNGWFEQNAWQTEEKHAREVGQKKPNPWSLHDMHGNVHEWCRDWYAERLPGGKDPEVTEEATYRIFRGGSWESYAINCRSAVRVWDGPDARYFNLGFRVAIVSTAPAKPVSQAPVITPSPMPTVTTSPRPLPGLDQLADAKAGDLWDGNGLKMKFRWCPPGKFKMGEFSSAVNVTLMQGFWLSQHEVTQAEWERIMGTTPWKGKVYIKEGDRYPAIYISWEKAAEFCKQLTELEREAGRLPENWIYTLPTEAQWEYACRAGTRTRYCFGDDEAQLGQYAWFEENASDAGEQYAHQVGLKKANSWNLHDMHGNAWEWCRDWYADKLPGGIDPESRDKSFSRILRGGGWDAFNGVGGAQACRSGYRTLSIPLNRFDLQSFRVALVSTGPARQPTPVVE